MVIATKGHEDSIEIRLGHKEDGYRYDPDYPPATTSVPRHLRKGIRERIISDGSVKTPLNEEDVRAACRYFLKEGVDLLPFPLSGRSCTRIMNSAQPRSFAR